MTAKHLRVIAIGVVVLLILWGASERWSRPADTTPAVLRLPVSAPDDVDTVAITEEADSVLLVRHPSGAWTVNRHPASASSVSDLFQALRDSVRPEVAAQSPSSFARMGVDSPASRLLRVSKSGKPLVQLFVGEYGPGSEAVYVRVVGDSRVYLWPGRLPTLVRRSADDWRDRQIGTVVPESVAVIEIQRGATRTTLRKEGASWVLPRDARADSAAVARLLHYLSTLAAAGFATDQQADSLTFAKPERRVSVRGAAAAPLLSLEFDSAAAGFWARTQARGTVYRLDFWQVDQLTPAEDALKSHP